MNTLIEELVDKYIICLSRSVYLEDAEDRRISLCIANCYKEMLEEKLQRTLSTEDIKNIQKGIDKNG